MSVFEYDQVNLRMIGGGVGTEAMAFLPVLGDAVLVKFHLTGEAVSDHDHKLGREQNLDLQETVFLRQLLTGMDRVLNGVCQSGGKLGGVCSVCVGEGEADVDRD